MKKLLASIYRIPVFINLGRPLFWMAQRSKLEPASLRLARFFAGLVHWTFGRRAQASATALAGEWNRLMPVPREAFPVVSGDEDTAYVEIRLECPLRGSGDAEACWRAMEFDRALMESSGGRLVVLQSQAVTGGSCCKLAIRRQGASVDDLPVAHPRWKT